MDLSTGFLIVLAALFLEKYLITIFSAAALGVALPVAALLGIAAVWQWGRSPWVKVPLGVGAKLAALGAVLLLAIPTSSWVTNRIDATYQTSIRESIESAEALPLGVGAKLAALGAVLLLAIPTSSWVTNRIDATYQTSIRESIESAEALAEGAAEVEKGDAKKDEAGILGFFQGAIDTVTGGITSAVEGAQESLNQFIESLAVMLVTSCLIPILVLLFYFWMADTVTGGITSAVEGAQESLNQFIESLAVMLVTSCLIPILVLLFYFWMAKILLGVNIDIPAVASALSPRKVRRRVSGAIKGGDRS